MNTSDYDCSRCKYHLRCLTEEKTPEVLSGIDAPSGPGCPKGCVWNTDTPPEFMNWRFSGEFVRIIGIPKDPRVPYPSMVGNIAEVQTTSEPGDFTYTFEVSFPDEKDNSKNNTASSK